MNNPLMAYQPHERVFLTLPTKGLYYPPGLIADPDEEIGVRKLSAKDEMILTNPDALMNGRAVSSVVQNCVSSIKDAGNLAVSDMEALMLAIKQASGQKEYEVNAECPKCKKHGLYTREIEDLLFNMSHHEKERTYEVNGLVIYLKPNSWKSHTKLQTLAFKQQKMVQLSKSENIADNDKVEMFRQVFDDMIELNMGLISDCVLGIETPDAKVDNPAFVRQYIETLDKDTIKEISVIIEELNKIGVEKEMDVRCECGHEWTIKNLRFDPSYFFGPSSYTAQEKK